MLNNFVAIDFETANFKRSSVCSVGIVVVENHQVVDEYYSLIHPTPNYYAQINTSIHGLTRRDTDSARLFPEVWSEIAPRVRDYPFVAHNSPFDESCLKAVMLSYGMNYPAAYRFFCTCLTSRRLLPQLPTISSIRWQVTVGSTSRRTTMPWRMRKRALILRSRFSNFFVPTKKPSSVETSEGYFVPRESGTDYGTICSTSSFFTVFTKSSRFTPRYKAIEAATNTEEYTPKQIPIVRARAK